MEWSKNNALRWGVDGGGVIWGNQLHCKIDIWNRQLKNFLTVIRNLKKNTTGQECKLNNTPSQWAEVTFSGLLS